jgi:hypothetical protein
VDPSNYKSDAALPATRRLCCCGSASVCQTQVDDVLAGNTVAATTTLATTTLSTTTLATTTLATTTLATTTLATTTLATTTLATTTLAATTLATTTTTESTGTPGLYLGLEGESCDATCSQQNLSPNDGSGYINSIARFNAAMVIAGGDPALCNNDYVAGSGIYAPICGFAQSFL